MISVSTRGLTATLAIGVTVPSASTRTGTFFFVGGRDLDRDDALRCLRRLGDGAAAAPITAASQPRRPARTSATAAPRHHVRFFIRCNRPGTSSARPGSLFTAPRRAIAAPC